jgi:UDP-N-acetylglucosamine:LPS N-acetylglucosamine transferase
MSNTAPAVVLSGSIGQGHDSVARACAAALADERAVEILDCMALLGGAGDRAGQAIFRRLLARPALYDALHFSALRAGGRLAEAMDELSARRLVPPLARTLRERQAELAIAVFATGVGALGRLRATHRSLRAVALCTDATAHRLWVHPAIDRYLVCSQMAAGTVRQHHPGAEIALITPPVRPEFFDAPPRPLAREALGCAPDVATVLLLGGAWGTAPLDTVAAALARAGFGVIAVAGTNAALRARLDALARRAPAPVRALGYCDDMARLYAACDVVVTSPGQACHEARVTRRPLVVLDTIPGHGRENVLLELERGGALAAPGRADAVVAAVGAALAGAAGPLPAWPVTGPEQWAAQLREALGDAGASAPRRTLSCSPALPRLHRSAAAQRDRPDRAAPGPPPAGRP